MDVQVVSCIVFIEKFDDVVFVVQCIINVGQCLIVCSGGYCYEDFVFNNFDGMIVDLSLFVMFEVCVDGLVCILVGMQNWNGYFELYKCYNVMLFGGLCYLVGVGGYICGGGYGLFLWL